MRFPGEENDLRVLVEIGRQWGYGNCIQALEVAWARELHADGIKYGVDRSAELHMLDRRIAAGQVAAKEMRRIKRREKGGGK